MDEDLNAALLLLFGRKDSAYPGRDASRVIARYGAIEGARLAARANGILDELDQIKPDWTKHSLRTAARAAAEQVRAKYPELNDDSVEALERIYAYGYK